MVGGGDSLSLSIYIYIYISLLLFHLLTLLEKHIIYIYIYIMLNLLTLLRSIKHNTGHASYCTMDFTKLENLLVINTRMDNLI